LSTLTKILIVLLTISSIFLCGIVVTYVANADNYRQRYSKREAKVDSLGEKVKHLTKQLNENIAKNQQREKELNNEIASLEKKANELQGNLKNVEREKAGLVQKVNSLASITENFSETTDKQRQLFENTFAELKKLKAERIKERKELNETTATLVEKMAIIEVLQAENKRLLEEKSELQNRLDRRLLPFGKVTVPPVPVTPEKSKVRLAMPAAGDIALKGRVTAVDLKNSMAEISIGTTDGVKESMKFYVTRGDEFICEILILDDIEAERAVGVLELVQQQPRVGDSVSTNL